MKSLILALLFCCAFCCNAFAQSQKEKVGAHLQKCSVTLLKNRNDRGSGAIITRLVEGKKINFVLTACHVIDDLRTVTTIIGEDGTDRKEVKYRDAEILQEWIDSTTGERVGETKMFARVITVDKDKDIALLRVKQAEWVNESIEFYLGETIPGPGAECAHCGSPGGQDIGAGSVLWGNVARVGCRIEEFGSEPFDQVNCSGLPGCLTGDTMIQLASGENIPIKEIVKDSNVLTYDNRIVMANGTWTEAIQPQDRILCFQPRNGTCITKQVSNRPVTSRSVVNVWPTGEKQVWKISTPNKSIKATANHPFVKLTKVPAIDGKQYLIAQWCPVSDLKIGDVVGVLKEHVEFRKSQALNICKTFGQQEDNNYLPAMRLMGFYVGDGYSRIRKEEGGEVDLYTFNDIMSNRYEQAIHKFWTYPVHRVKTHSGHYLSITRQDFAKLFKNLGLTGSAKTKRIPSWIFQCPRELQHEFMEGYVDADGHRRTQGNSSWWSLEAANNELIGDFYALATNLGYTTSNITHRNRTAKLDGRDIQSETWSCDIWPKANKSGAQLIGTVDLLPNGLRWERIKSIEKVGIEMTYDMEVQTSHNFFANGFLVHNSSGGMVTNTDGLYIGMVTLGLGSGDSFHWMVSVRTIRKWAKEINVEWLLDPKGTTTEEALKKLKLERVRPGFTSMTAKKEPTPATEKQDLQEGNTSLIIKRVN